MTIADLLCDVCGRALAGSAILAPGSPRSGVRLMVHPGDPKVKDDGVLVCVSCWSETRTRLGEPRAGECASCGIAVEYEESLHVIEMTGRAGDVPLWQLCRAHAMEFLNGLRFVEPKLGPGDLALKADFGPD
jgi:hypothetical protein